MPKRGLSLSFMTFSSPGWCGRCLEEAGRVMTDVLKVVEMFNNF